MTLLTSTSRSRILPSVSTHGDMRKRGHRSVETVAAIWLHDIVSDPCATDDEEQSAAQAIRDLVDAQTDAKCIVG